MPPVNVPKITFGLCVTILVVCIFSLGATIANLVYYTRLKNSPVCNNEPITAQQITSMLTINSILLILLFAILIMSSVAIGASRRQLRQLIALGPEVQRSLSVQQGIIAPDIAQAPPRSGGYLLYVLPRALLLSPNLSLLEGFEDTPTPRARSVPVQPGQPGGQPVAQLRPLASAGAAPRGQGAPASAAAQRPGNAAPAPQRPAAASQRPQNIPTVFQTEGFRPVQGPAPAPAPAPSRRTVPEGFISTSTASAATIRPTAAASAIPPPPQPQRGPATAIPPPPQPQRGPTAAIPPPPQPQRGQQRQGEEFPREPETSTIC